jgi:cytochrome b561
MRYLQIPLYFFGALAVIVLVLRLFMPFREIWRRWKQVAHRLGVWQTNLILTLLYFLIIPLFALLAGRKRLRLKLDPAATTYWEDVTPLPHTLEDAHRPF